MRQIYNQNEALKQYAEDVNKFQNLSDEETRKLATEAQRGDKEARDKLLHHHAKYVFKILGNFYNLEYQKQEMEDLVQEGMLGLLEAIDHYKVTDEAKFCTYSSFWIKKMISAKLMSLTNNAVYRPEKRIRRTAMLINAVADYELLHGEKPDNETLSKITGETVEAIEDLLSDQLLNMSSLDDPTPVGDSSNECLPILEIVPDRTLDVEDSVVRKVFDEEYKQLLFQVFPDKVDRMILECLMDNEKVSHRDIAEQLGCSRQNVSKKVKRIREVMINTGYYAPDDDFGLDEE